jgi:hypothetical protein
LSGDIETPVNLLEGRPNSRHVGVEGIALISRRTTIRVNGTETDQL